ncbi:hypothetical protein Tco_1391246 [Tanacetum coccineum]
MFLDSDPEEEPEEDDEDLRRSPLITLAKGMMRMMMIRTRTRRRKEEEHTRSCRLCHTYTLYEPPGYHPDDPSIITSPRKKVLRYEIGESSAIATTRPIRGRRVDYGFVGTMDTKIRRRRAKEGGVNTGRTELTAVYSRHAGYLYRDRGYQQADPDMIRSVKTMVE